MRLATLEQLPGTVSASTVGESEAEAGPRPFLDLSVRSKIQEHSTVTSLESLASSIDLRDEPTDKNLKRIRDDVISNTEKESQVKEQHNNFRGIYPCGDTSKYSPKKNRSN